MRLFNRKNGTEKERIWGLRIYKISKNNKIIKKYVFLTIEVAKFLLVRLHELITVTENNNIKGSKQ